MAAKGIGPLLLLGGAAALLLMTKKKDDDKPKAAGGFELVGECEGVTTTDLGEAFEFLTNSLNDIFIREGIDPNSLSGLDPDNIEDYIAEIYQGAFPQCQWPPASPDEFMVGLPGQEKSWNMMMDALREQLLAQRPETLLTGTMIGEVPQRAQKTKLLTKLIIE